MLRSIPYVCSVVGSFKSHNAYNASEWWGQREPPDSDPGGVKQSQWTARYITMHQAGHAHVSRNRIESQCHEMPSRSSHDAPGYADRLKLNLRLVHDVRCALPHLALLVDLYPSSRVRLVLTLNALSSIFLTCTFDSTHSKTTTATSQTQTPSKLPPHPYILKHSYL